MQILLGRIPWYNTNSVTIIGTRLKHSLDRDRDQDENLGVGEYARGWFKRREKVHKGVIKDYLLDDFSVQAKSIFQLKAHLLQKIMLSKCLPIEDGGVDCHN